MAGCEIRRITAEETRALRLRVLRPGQRLEDVHWPGDEDPGTIHLGVFIDGVQVGATTLRRAPMPERPGIENAWQGRGMAILPEYQHRGIGGQLTAAAFAALREHGARLLWGNARESALPFYRGLGFSILDETFIPDGVNIPHRRVFIEFPEE